VNRSADRQTDRQTDMTKLTVTFRHFGNAPKMTTSLFSSYNPRGKCLERPNFLNPKHMYIRIIQVQRLMQMLNVPFCARIIPEWLFLKYLKKKVIDI